MEYVIHGSTLDAFADAIRSKTSREDTLTPAELRSAIQSCLENPDGEQLAVGDGTYDVANVKSLVVQSDIDPDDLLYYTYDEVSTTMTVSVNPNAAYSFDVINLDKLLADVYLANLQRLIADPPQMKGMDWLIAYLVNCDIDTFADYVADNKSAAWFFFQRAIMGEKYSAETLPMEMLSGKSTQLGLSGTIVGVNMTTCATCNGTGQITSSTPVLCANCTGSGTITTTDYCTTCNSTGMMPVRDNTSGKFIFDHGVFVEGHYETCTTCGGTGISGTTTTTCSVCHGAGTVTGTVRCPTCRGQGSVPGSGTSGTVGSVTGSYDSGTKTLTTVYKFSRQGCDFINFTGADGTLLSVSSEELPFGIYEASAEVAYSGTSWSGTWPVTLQISFRGGLMSAEDLSTAAGTPIRFSVPASAPCATRAYLKVIPASADQSIMLTDGGTITQTVTISLKLISAEQSYGTATLSDVLRFADTTNRYKMRCIGALYPTLLIDPLEELVKGYPVNAFSYVSTGAEETESSSAITITTNCTAFKNSDTSGNEYTVNSMKVKYQPSGKCYSYLTDNTDGQTTNCTFRAYQYDICRRSDADG